MDRPTSVFADPDTPDRLIGFARVQPIAFRDGQHSLEPLPGHMDSGTIVTGESGTPVFTVVIPTYNRAEALRTCLESLVAQRYPRELFEVIVVDDGSVAPTAPVVAEYSDRLQVSVHRQARAGPAAARNRGAMDARGCYVAFIDDDCVADAGWLAALDAGFRTHPKGAMLGGDIENPCGDNVRAEVGELILNVLLERYQPEPGGVYFFRTANLAVRSDEFRASGGFDTSFETAEDREFCDRWLYRSGTMIRMPTATVSHASPLTWRGFLYRHYRYGRGAYRFHRLRRHRGSGRFRLEFVWFYFFVLQACLASRRGIVRKLVLVFLWQVCNVLGFVAELLRERRASAPGWGAS